MRYACCRLEWLTMISTIERLASDWLSWIEHYPSRTRRMAQMVFQDCNSANTALYGCGYAKQSDLFNQEKRWRQQWQCVRSVTMAKPIQIVRKLLNAMKCSHFYGKFVVMLLIGHSKFIKQVCYDDIMMMLCAISGLLWSKSMRMTMKTTKTTKNEQ